MDIVKITNQRTYTEDKQTYILRDVETSEGEKKTQYKVLEPWGEEFWNDCEPAESDILGARPYDQSEHAMERVKKAGKTRVQDEPAPVEPADNNEDSKTKRKTASSRKADASS